MEPGDCGCTGRRKTREMGGLSPRLADSLPASQARLVPLQGAGISRRPWVGPTPPPRAHCRAASVPTLDTSSRGGLPQDEGFRCHFAHQTCSLRKARFEPEVDRGVRDGFRGKTRAATQDWPHPAPPRTPREGFQEDSIGVGGRSGGGVGEMSKIRNKKPQARLQPWRWSCQEARCGCWKRAFHLASPSIPAASPGTGPAEPGLPTAGAAATAQRGSLRCARRDRHRQTDTYTSQKAPRRSSLSWLRDRWQQACSPCFSRRFAPWCLNVLRRNQGLLQPGSAHPSGAGTRAWYAIRTHQVAAVLTGGRPWALREHW